MQKYCKVLDEETGLVKIGVGCTDDYYIEIGMEIRDVQQSDINGEWYLSNKCPMRPIPTEEEIRQAEINRINNLTMTAQDLLDMIHNLGASWDSIDDYLNAHKELKLRLTTCQNVFCGVLRQLLPLDVDGVEITDEMVVRAFEIKNSQNIN